MVFKGLFQFKLSYDFVIKLFYSFKQKDSLAVHLTEKYYCIYECKILLYLEPFSVPNFSEMIAVLQ